MIADFQSLIQAFPEAVIGGLLIACACSALGVFVILKRVVFIGLALSEVAACGIAAAMLFNASPFLGATSLTLATVLILAYPFEGWRVPRDTILGVVFVLAAGLSILLVAKSGFGLSEVKALLYGDLILTSRKDLVLLVAVLAPVLAYFFLFMRPTLYTFLDREGAKVLGVRVVLWELLYFLALGLTVSAASKVAGALLVFCYLVVAPSSALALARRLWLVFVLSGLSAALSTLIGLHWAFSHDLPANQTIAVVSCVLFGLALLVSFAWGALKRARGQNKRPA